MVINSIKPITNYAFDEILWGKTQSVNFFEQLPTCIGVHRSLPYYLGLNVYTVQDQKASHCNNNKFVGWPYLL